MCRIGPSLPLGAERVGVRWGIPETLRLSASPKRPPGVAAHLTPTLSPREGGRRGSLAQMRCACHRREDRSGSVPGFAATHAPRLIFIEYELI